MVTTEIAHYSKECTGWREALRSQREEFNRMKNELQQVAAHITSKEALINVEHYENQFDIQLDNIHDLKQSIKAHEKMSALETVPDYMFSSGSMVSDHEKLFSDYQSLRHTLHQIKSDFRQFLINYT